MARSDEQNRLARERARGVILQAAIETFAERGVTGASIAEITQRAGVAQGLVNYHFGGKDQLVVAVIDQWFEALFGIPEVPGDADLRLAGIIDGAIMATGYALPLQKVVLALQQQPATHRLYAQAEDRHHERAVAAEEKVRDIFRERGAADPELEEIMLRGTLEGILLKFAVYEETFPLEDARRWMYRLYALPEPAQPLPLTGPARATPLRLRASGVVTGASKGADAD
ncbi:TetR/AcrR family transcriptional regulator [Microbacterium sp. NPDC089695]|uniref:TetR/AcrR family transcriptional regulator n=1 Tax=Microbacterium sp. NPDC089695 TaxID=3364198 RepID=UPI0037F72B9B